MRGRVLVTGASVAGATAAYWLDRAGYDVIVLESAPSLREGGQNIDVRASARDVLRLMGVEDEVRARNTGEVGTRFVDDVGATVSEFPVDDTDGHDGPTAELEILRGALAGIIVDACPDSVEWRFGDRVVGLDDDGGSVEVALSDGTRERFDLVVVAEGVGSSTRALVLGDEVEERALGMYIAYGTIDRTATDDDWWRVQVVPGARQVSLRPDDVGTTRAMLTFRADEPVLDGLDDAEVRAAFRDRFGDLGWEVPRILDGFDGGDDLYVDWLRQVVASTWSRGRVCLLGDAAWCVTPIGGGGTSLAILGAYVLSALLSQHADEPDGHASAFAAYDATMRPLVEDAQQLPPGTPRIASPESRLGVGALRLGTRVAASPVVRAVTSRLGAGPGTAAELPDLPALVEPDRPGRARPGG